MDPWPSHYYKPCIIWQAVVTLNVSLCTESVEESNVFYCFHLFVCLKMCIVWFDHFALCMFGYDYSLFNLHIPLSLLLLQSCLLFSWLAWFLLGFVHSDLFFKLWIFSCSSMYSKSSWYSHYWAGGHIVSLSESPGFSFKQESNSLSWTSHGKPHSRTINYGLHNSMFQILTFKHGLCHEQNSLWPIF